MELISREETINNAHRQIWYRMNPSMKGRIDEWLNSLPTVDAKPVVHGKWINHWLNPNNENSLVFKCSICAAIAAGRHNFCPNCGAIMDGKDKVEV